MSKMKMLPGEDFYLTRSVEDDVITTPAFSINQI